MTFSLGKACRYCATFFKPKTLSQRFCTPAHRYRFNYKTKYYPRHIQSKKPLWIERRCKGCKCHFHLEGRGRGKQHRLYCTERCAKNTRSRRYNAKKKTILRPRP